MQRMRLPAWVFAFVLAVACSHPGKDALMLQRTVMGSMPPPPGAALVSERYIPAHYNIGAQGEICAEYERLFATNDPSAFVAHVRQVALGSSRVRIRQLPTHPAINESYGYSTTGSLTGEGVRVSIGFFDLESPAWRPRYERSIDVHAWRFAAEVRVHDDCHQLNERL